MRWGRGEGDIGSNGKACDAVVASGKLPYSNGFGLECARRNRWILYTLADVVCPESWVFVFVSLCGFPGGDDGK